MARALNLNRLKQLLEIRQSERQIAEIDLFEARRSRDRAEEVVVVASEKLNNAIQSWQSCRSGQHIDLGIEPSLAKQVILSDSLVNQSKQLAAIAAEREEKTKDRWQQSDLNMRATEKKAKVAARQVQSKRDEKQLMEAADQFGYRRITK